MAIDAQDITNLLTLALGAATVWLGWETRRVATATKDAVQLQSRPNLSIVKVEAVVGQIRMVANANQVPAIRFALCLSNPGQVRVTYEIESIAVTYETAQLTNPTFSNRGGVIHPKDETKFFYPWIPAPYPPQPTHGGEATFRINYWSTLNHVEHVEGRLKYWLQHQNLGTTEWIWLDGPRYA